MHSDRSKLISFRRLIVFGLILSCLTGILVAQTFHYSRGWTNGKRPFPMISSIRDRNDASDSVGIWEMQRLQRLLELSQCCGSSLPDETLETVVDNFNQRKNHI